MVDCDPHGVDIMRTYKYGSKSLGHEACTRVPGLHWLGVRMDDIFVAANCVPSDLLDVQSPQRSDSQYSSSSLTGFSQTSRNQASPYSQSGAQRTALESLIQLTPSDRKTAQRIFQTIVGVGEAFELELDQEEAEQMREIQVMLMLNMKAEIQAIDNRGDLSSWLDEKMGIA